MMNIQYIIIFRILMLSSAFGTFNISFVTYKTKYLFPKTLSMLCNGSNTLNNFVCKTRAGPEEGCYHFELFPMTDDLKQRVLYGHNGLRNLEAKRVGWEIANMNILHWDDDLAEMAKQRLYHCGDSIIDDSFLVTDEFPVGNNTFYMRGFPGYNKWLSVAIHSWYNHSKVNTPAQFTPTAIFTPFIQLIYPRSEFVGCAGARVNHGTKFLCYYGPNPDKITFYKSFLHGKTCTQCDEDRTTCSLLFNGLCGLDLYAGSFRNQPNALLILFIVFTCINIGCNCI